MTSGIPESIQLLHLSESSLTCDLEPTTLCEVSNPVCKEYLMKNIVSASEKIVKVSDDFSAWRMPLTR